MNLKAELCQWSVLPSLTDLLGNLPVMLVPPAPAFNPLQNVEKTLIVTFTK